MDINESLRRVNELLKGCGQDMKKTNLGSFKITERGPVHIGGGDEEMKEQKKLGAIKPGATTLKEAKQALSAAREKKESVPAPPPIPKEAAVEKALTAGAIPRRMIPRAMASDSMRMGNMVMTRRNLGFDQADDLGSNQGELLRMQETYKSCNTCGRVYLAKSQSDGCPSCVLENQVTCKSCSRQLFKSIDGSKHCIVCG